MLSRRALIGSTAVLAAGCGGLDIPFPALGTPKIAPLTWVSRPYTGLSSGPVVASFEDMLRRVERDLQADTESPFGPTQGRYSLDLQYFEHYAGSYSDPESEQFRNPEFMATWLEEIEADLVTVWHDEARVLGEMGVLLPLDQFAGADNIDFEREFYSPLLESFRENGALYALPADAFPLMLYYDADYFAEMGVVPPDASWDWDILVENALNLTQREEDGTVSRWGLVTHTEPIWWALWQNEAELADALTLQCRLQEPTAIEALDFFRGLMHTHGVSPAVFSMDLWRIIDDPAGSPPAMMYTLIPLGYSRNNYRRAALPRGKVRSVPAHTDAGIAIVAQTAKPDAAYAALRGILRAMQPYVNAPAERENMERFGTIRPDLQPEEVTAIRQSMENGRVEPHEPALHRAMYSLVEALVRGDEVASAVNQACSVLYENR
ncbi:MAG: extracellular solute-binding protein [Chloroflexi bacterium]|nr:extracellular solute-binding protein [Chloroflexota bacterium]